jgi:hypothetical protein
VYQVTLDKSTTGEDNQRVEAVDKAVSHLLARAEDLIWLKSFTVRSLLLIIKLMIAGRRMIQACRSDP